MKKSLIALALAIAAPPAANASESNGIGYSSVELDYLYEDSYARGGVGIRGSYAFTDSFFATGSYARTESSENPGGWSGYARDSAHKSWALGLGFNTAIGARTDWVSQLAFARHDYSNLMVAVVRLGHA